MASRCRHTREYKFIHVDPSIQKKPCRRLNTIKKAVRRGGNIKHNPKAKTYLVSKKPNRKDANNNKDTLSRVLEESLPSPEASDRPCSSEGSVSPQEIASCQPPGLHSGKRKGKGKRVSFALPAESQESSFSSNVQLDQRNEAASSSASEDLKMTLGIKAGLDGHAVGDSLESLVDSADSEMDQLAYQLAAIVGKQDNTMRRMMQEVECLYAMRHEMDASVSLKSACHKDEDEEEDMCAAVGRDFFENVFGPEDVFGPDSAGFRDLQLIYGLADKVNKQNKALKSIRQEVECLEHMLHDTGKRVVRALSQPSADFDTACHEDENLLAAVGEEYFEAGRQYERENMEGSRQGQPESSRQGIEHLQPSQPLVD